MSPGPRTSASRGRSGCPIGADIAASRRSKVDKFLPFGSRLRERFTDFTKNLDRSAAKRPRGQHADRARLLGGLIAVAPYRVDIVSTEQQRRSGNRRAADREFVSGRGRLQIGAAT